LRAVIFVLMGGAAVAGAVTVVLARNPVYSAMGLLATLFSVAVLYVSQLAHVVAAVQVIVYAGAVMTLFLFVIMLIGVDKSETRDESLPFQRWMVAVLGDHRPADRPHRLRRLRLGAGRIGGAGGRDQRHRRSGVAEPLFTEWVLAFEATALLLTIAAPGHRPGHYHRRRES
jgi:NADH-quinone oxidoreductase subunit J